MAVLINKLHDGELLGLWDADRPVDVDIEVAGSSFTSVSLNRNVRIGSLGTHLIVSGNERRLYFHYTLPGASSLYYSVSSRRIVFGEYKWRVAKQIARVARKPVPVHQAKAGVLYAFDSRGLRRFNGDSVVGFGNTPIDPNEASDEFFDIVVESVKECVGPVDDSGIAMYHDGSPNSTMLVLACVAAGIPVWSYSVVDEVENGTVVELDRSRDNLANAVNLCVEICESRKPRVVANSVMMHKALSEAKDDGFSRIMVPFLKEYDGSDSLVIQSQKNCSWLGLSMIAPLAFHRVASFLGSSEHASDLLTCGYLTKRNHSAHSSTWISDLVDSEDVLSQESIDDIYSKHKL